MDYYNNTELINSAKSLGRVEVLTEILDWAKNQKGDVIVQRKISEMLSN
jgi:hypothetical protein